MHRFLPKTLRRIAALGTLGSAALVLSATACNSDDDFLTESPKNIIVADNLYTNLAGFEAGLNALYANVRRERYGSDNTSNDLVATLMTSGTDNAYGNYLSPMERIFNEFGVMNSPSNAFIRSFWNLMYQTINASNTIITRAENPAVTWSADDRDRVIAEARLIRAWAYRHLTYLYGDVPVTLTESTGEAIKTDWERVPRDSVRKVIIADLQFAEAHLPTSSTNPGKVVKAVAQHYLAEMYLATNDPAKAETEAQAVIATPGYALITQRYGVQASQPGVAFMDQFKDGNVNRSQGNTEVLWALQYALSTTGGGASIMRRTWVTRYEGNGGMAISADNGGRGIGRLAITKWALNLYEPNDVRGGQYAIRRFYLYNTTTKLPAGKKLGDTLFTVLPTPIEKVSDMLVPSTRKWDYANPIDITGADQYNDQPYLRLADTYLLLAEAQLKQGKLAESAASINKVRARAGASAITPAQVTLDFILDERSRELVTEEQRRYTLLRTGTLLTRTKLHNPLSGATMQPRDTLLPVPQDVIDANTGKPMKQNPGF